MKNDCITPSRVGSVTTSWAGAVAATPDSNKSVSNVCRFDKTVGLQKKPRLSHNFLWGVSCVSLFLQRHFFTDLYTASM